MQWGLALVTVKNVVIDSCNFEIAHLKKKVLAIWWLSGWYFHYVFSCH